MSLRRKNKISSSRKYAKMARPIIKTLFVTTFLLLSCNLITCAKTLKKPTVLVGMLIRNKAHTLPYFLSFFEALDYPKDRMTLCIRSDNNIDDTLEILEYWLETRGDKYHAVDLIVDHESSGFQDEASITDWPLSRFLHVMNLREGILNLGRKIWADYIFMLDVDVFLTNSDALNLLISKGKTIVAPMLESDNMYSNFWAAMAPNYYYTRSERYKPILEREAVGCHKVPMVHSALLIDSRTLRSDSLTYNFERLRNYNGPKDDIIVFAVGANMSNVPIHVCNDNAYGFILRPLENYESLSRDIEQLTILKLAQLNNERILGISEDMRKFVKYPEKDTMGFDKIYMINLQRRPERRTRMEQCFEELGILAETVNAVDGRTLNKTILDKWGVKTMPDYADPYHKRPMTMGEIGCFLSHYVVWKKMFDNDYDRVMVLEDDVHFEPAFRQKVQNLFDEIDTLHLEWDLIYLGRKKLTKDEEPTIKGSNHLLRPTYSYWTIGYILSRSGARKLLEAKPLDNMLPVDEYLPILFDDHPRDAWKRFFPRRDLVALSINPLVIYPTRYTGQTGYVSDTEDSNIVAMTTDEIRRLKDEM